VVFALISTFVAAVAVGQILLFGGRYPRAASIWVGGCFLPLQAITGFLWLCLASGRGSLLSLRELFVIFGMLILSIPIGAGVGYLSGCLIGGVFLILDALARRQQSPRDAVEAAEPPEPTEVVQDRSYERHEEN
jgi:hypothetical protein